MKLLITGGAGFIGSAVVRRALASGHEVVNLDAMTYAASPATLDAVSGRSGYTFEHADIREADAVKRIFFAHHPDAVLHLAAESHVDRSIDGARIFVETNVVGTYNLLEAARSYWEQAGRPAAFRFLHVSTDEVYGSLGSEGRFTEQSAYTPNSPYAATKAASDHLARAWHATFGLPVITSNCSNNYGPYQFPEKLIPVVILNAIRNLPIPVYGTGNNIRDWLFVEDHADALLTVLRHGQIGQTYNIGGDCEVQNGDLVQMICDMMDRMAPGVGSYGELVTYVKDRPGHDLRYAIDASRVQAELGWRASVTLQEGLERTVKWYVDHSNWWQPLLDRGGVGDRLGTL